jgi:hypothetical protein
MGELRPPLYTPTGLTPYLYLPLLSQRVYDHRCDNMATQVTAIILQVLVIKMISAYFYDIDCVETPETLVCPYKGPGVLTPTREHATIKRLKIGQLKGLSVIMSEFADHVIVEYTQTEDHHSNICEHLLNIEPRQHVTATNQAGITTACVSTKIL